MWVGSFMIFFGGWTLKQAYLNPNELCWNHNEAQPGSSRLRTLDVGSTAGQSAYTFLDCCKTINSPIYFKRPEIETSIYWQAPMNTLSDRVLHNIFYLPVVPEINVCSLVNYFNITQNLGLNFHLQHWRDTHMPHMYILRPEVVHNWKKMPNIYIWKGGYNYEK